MLIKIEGHVNVVDMQTCVARYQRRSFMVVVGRTGTQRGCLGTSLDPNDFQGIVQL